MPRYFFHLHAGESRANTDSSGQHLPDADAAHEMSQRIARRLLEWNLEPVPWLDYQIRVADKAGEIVFDLPFTKAVGQTCDDGRRAKAAAVDPSPKEELLGEGLLRSAQDNTSPAEDTHVVGRPHVEAPGLAGDSGVTSWMSGLQEAIEAHVRDLDRADQPWMALESVRDTESKPRTQLQTAARPFTSSEQSERDRSAQSKAGEKKRSLRQLFRSTQRALS